LLLLNELSRMHYDRHDFSESMAANEQILHAMRGAGLDRSAGYAVILMNLSTLLKSVGEIVAAAELQSDIHANLRHLQMAVGYERPLAGSYLRLARYQEALQLLRDGEPATRQSKNAIALAENYLLQGRVLIFLGEYAQASEHLDQAQALLVAEPTRNRQMLATLDFARCQLALRRGELAQARALNMKQMQALAAPPGNRSVLRLNVLRVAAELAVEDGDAATARRHADEAVQLAESLARDKTRSADVGQALLVRARTLLALDESALARADLTAADVALTQGLGANHPDTVAARELLITL
jgi:tetratricopeptide (TPR) repeat protein